MFVAKHRLRTVGSLLAFMGLAACAEVTVVHDIDEKEANQILLLLARDDIPASKGIRDTGREVFYFVNVPAVREKEALEVLAKNEHPRRKPKGRTEVFMGGGMIPTRAEEQAKALSALEGEIERQLGLVAGVLDVEVNVVIPEDSPLKTSEEVISPATASVAIRYLPVVDRPKPLSEASVRAVVAASVEKLTTDHVVVMMTPVQAAVMEQQAAAASADCAECSGFPCNLTRKGRKTLLAAVSIGMIFLGIVAAFMYARLRNVRARLIRLQNEIARARRKPTSEIAPPA